MTIGKLLNDRCRLAQDGSLSNSSQQTSPHLEGVESLKPSGRKNYIRLLLQQALKLFDAKSAAIVYGSDASHKSFLPTSEWDRAVIGHVDGKGLQGFALRYFGTMIIRVKKLSPILLHTVDEQGHKKETEGIIPHILRSYAAFYKTGINVLIVPDIAEQVQVSTSEFLHLKTYSYNGSEFSEPAEKLMTTLSIVRSFDAKNFLGVLIPDCGLLVINTADNDLVHVENGTFVREQELSEKLDILIKSIEDGSLAILYCLSVKQGSELLWHKERSLRKTAQDLNKKEIALNQKEEELDRQRAYLRAVGGVTEEQLNMEPTEINEGVYTITDMVGSTIVRKFYNGAEYFFLTNAGRRIMVQVAHHFQCRLDNYIGDAILIEHVYLFDRTDQHPNQISFQERIMIVVLMLSTIFNELSQLIQGNHPVDLEQKVPRLLEREQQSLSYRAGVEAGRAIIGPIGTSARKIITGIGEAVDNASRLESTGKPNAIHLSSKVFHLLKNGVISQESRLLYNIITKSEPRPCDIFAPVRSRLLAGESLSFIELYRSIFPPAPHGSGRTPTTSSVFIKITGVSYKEYHPDSTYLLWPVRQKVAC